MPYPIKRHNTPDLFFKYHKLQIKTPIRKPYKHSTYPSALGRAHKRSENGSQQYSHVLNTHHRSEQR